MFCTNAVEKIFAASLFWLSLSGTICIRVFELREPSGYFATFDRALEQVWNCFGGFPTRLQTLFGRPSSGHLERTPCRNSSSRCPVILPCLENRFETAFRRLFGQLCNSTRALRISGRKCRRGTWNGRNEELITTPVLSSYARSSLFTLFYFKPINTFRKTPVDCREPA